MAKQITAAQKDTQLQVRPSSPSCPLSPLPGGDYFNHKCFACKYRELLLIVMIVNLQKVQKEAVL